MIKTLTNAIIFTVISLSAFNAFAQPGYQDLLISEISRENVSQDYLEIYNNTSINISLTNCKLIRYKTNQSAILYIYDFGVDGSGDLIVPANGFIIVAKNSTESSFDTYWGTNLSATGVNFNNSAGVYINERSIYSLRYGGTLNTNDGTLIDETTTPPNNYAVRVYQNPIGYFYRHPTLGPLNYSPGHFKIEDDLSHWDIVRRDFTWLPVAPSSSTGSSNVLIHGKNTSIVNGAQMNDLSIIANQSVSIGTQNITILGDLFLSVNSKLSIVSSGSANVTGTTTIEILGQNSETIYNIWSSPFSSSPNILSAFPGANPCDILQFQASSQYFKYDYMVPFVTTCNGNGVTFNTNHVIPTPEGNPDGNFDLGRGYFIPGSSTSPIRSISSSSSPANGSISINIYGSNGGLVDGSNDWNLIGNPYISGLNVYGLIATNAQKINAVYLLANGIYNTYNLGNVINIAPSQGFFVDILNAIDGPSGSFTFKNEHRTSTSEFFSKTDDNSIDTTILFLSINNPTGTIDRTQLHLDEDCLDEYDIKWDAHKLTNGNGLNFGTKINDLKYAINGLQNLVDQESKIIPLYVQTNETGLFEIKLDSLRDMPLGMSFYLEDKQLNTMTNLRTNDYSFNSPQPDTLDDRFFLHLSYDASITSVDEVNETSSILIYAQEDFIQIKNTDVNQNIAHIQVYDIVGKLMVDQSNSGSTAIVPTSGYQSGIYIVKTIDQDGNIFNKRVFVK